MSKGLQIAIGALVVAALLGWYGWASLGGEGTFRYYQTLAEFQQAEPDGPARVHAYVAPGTIERDLASKSVRFAVQETPPHAGGDDGPQLSVHFASLETPDLFADGAEVVLEGALHSHAGAAVFHADKIFAKCPSKFRAAEGEQASL